MHLLGRLQSILLIYSSIMNLENISVIFLEIIKHLLKEYIEEMLPTHIHSC